MPAITRAHALGAVGTGSQDGDPFAAFRGGPISQSLRLQGETTSHSALALNPGGEGHNEARRAADGGNGAGGTMPSPVQRASFGGGSVPPPEPPQGATATIAKTPFFFVATRLRRHFQPWMLFSKIAGGKVTVPRLILLQLLQGRRQPSPGELLRRPAGAARPVRVQHVHALPPTRPHCSERLHGHAVPQLNLRHDSPSSMSRSSSCALRPPPPAAAAAAIACQ